MIKVSYVDNFGGEHVSHRIDAEEGKALVRQGNSPHRKAYPNVETALNEVLKDYAGWIAEGYCKSFSVSVE